MERTLPINPYILDYAPKDYAGHVPQGAVRVDCSLGVNSDLLGNCVFRRLHDFQQRTALHSGNFAEIKYYPHGESLKAALAGWYHRNGVGRDWLTEGHFVLGNGSYDILCALNLLCLTRGKTVLGHAPQFTAYIDHVACSGSRYEAYFLSREDNYRFDTPAYLARMNASHDLFIVENPNNPTGQVIPLQEIRAIAHRAAELGRILVVDEAYAEYMPFSNSAINLVRDCPNVVVTRSFSKGWGMAGVRLGYAVASPENGLLSQLQKLVLPFNSNGIARVLAQAALETRLEHPEDPFGIRPVRRSKELLTAAIGRANARSGRELKTAATFGSTPIMTLYYEGGGGDFDLQRHLMDFGILTVSCGTYVGLDQRAVRLMLPEEAALPLLLELMEEAVAALPVRI